MLRVAMWHPPKKAAAIPIWKSMPSPLASDKNPIKIVGQAARVRNVDHG
jgi:hypothetical protein